MKAALLPDRGVVKVVGDPARTFLNGLVTSNIGVVTPGCPAFAALLSPQGKIVVDAIVVEAPAGDGGGFFLDCPRALAGALAAKLEFYKLRAKVAIHDLSATLGVLAVWGDHAGVDGDLAYRDPRLPALGTRVIIPADRATATAAGLGAEPADASDYDTHRIALGIPRGGIDFTYGDAFPHESDMDQLGGVDFAKGCYVGQEVVSRMQHRGSARTRVVPVACDGPAPEPGTPVIAGDKTVGTFGSSASGRALALLRLDRVEEALAAGVAITAGGATLRLVRPQWARFAWPGEPKAAE